MYEISSVLCVGTYALKENVQTVMSLSKEVLGYYRLLCLANIHVAPLTGSGYAR